MNPPTPPAGWKTTEWWTSLAHIVLTLLVTLGVVKASDLATLDGALAAGVTAAFGLAASAGVVVAYAKGRVALKAAHLDAAKGKA